MSEELAEIRSVMPDIAGIGAAMWNVSRVSGGKLVLSEYFSPDELHEYFRMTRSSRKDEWLAARVVLKKKLIADGAVRNPRDLIVRKDERGCPYAVLWEPDTGRYERIPCSFAHKGKLVCVAYSHDHSRRIGIDVERRSWRISFLRHKFISPDDRLLDKGDGVGDDTVLWSFKESASKLLGVGYGCGFKTISCRETGSGVCELGRKTDPNGEEEIFLGRYGWFGKYVITLVMDPPAAAAPKLTHIRKYGFLEKLKRAAKLRKIKWSNKSDAKRGHGDA